MGLAQSPPRSGPRKMSRRCSTRETALFRHCTPELAQTQNTLRIRAVHLLDGFQLWHGFDMSIWSEKMIPKERTYTLLRNVEARRHQLPCK